MATLLRTSFIVSVSIEPSGHTAYGVCVPTSTRVVRHTFFAPNTTNIPAEFARTTLTVTSLLRIHSTSACPSFTEPPLVCNTITSPSSIVLHILRAVTSRSIKPTVMVLASTATLTRPSIKPIHTAVTSNHTFLRCFIDTFLYHHLACKYPVVAAYQHVVF